MLLSISYLSTHPALQVEYVLLVCNLLPVGISDLSYYYIIEQLVVVTLDIPLKYICMHRNSAESNRIKQF